MPPHPEKRGPAPAAGPEAYLALLKPRVMSLVIFTAAVGMVAAYAAGAYLHPGLALVSLLAIAVGAGASGALNMWWDADIDAVMARTANRPVPRGQVPRPEAAGFGGALSALSVALLALSSNYLAAGLLAFTIFFYVIVYSMWLKRSTAQNIVIGGAAGALPPVVAWAAVSGDMPVAAWILFAIIFLWTPPHFWALALYKEGDYARAGIPMLPNVAGHDATRRQILIYSVLLALSGIAPVAVGMGGFVYLAVAVLMGGYFVKLAVDLLRADKNDKGPAKKLFAYSIVYLFGIFAAVLVEDLVVLAAPFIS
ncbi:MAG: heme o synthase [Pseudomonadota bacterium]